MTRSLYSKFILGYLIFGLLGFLTIATFSSRMVREHLVQERADAQAEGGAWYPESMEAWSNAQVIQEGTCVALIASSQHQDELAASFQEQFA